jgi:hypothetical protein
MCQYFTTDYNEQCQKQRVPLAPMYKDILDVHIQIKLRFFCLDHAEADKLPLDTCGSGFPVEQ